MDFFLAILLGAVQGVLEFLPLSSSGHLVILERLSGIQIPALTFHVFLHAGTMIAVFITMRREVVRMFAEGFRIYAVILGNLAGSVRQDSRERPAAFSKTAHTNSGKLSYIIFTAMIPTAATGLLLRNMVASAADSPFFAGIGFLITGIVLLVTDRVAPGSTVPKEVPARAAWLAGLINGLTVFPGISSTAIMLCAGIYAGFNRKTAVRFTLLLSVPTVFAAFVLEVIVGIVQGIFSTQVLLVCILGMLSAAVTGTLVINTFIRLLRRSRFTNFAYYSFAIGMTAILIGYLLR